MKRAKFSLLRPAAFITLIAAWTIGYYWQQPDYHQQLQAKFPSASISFNQQSNDYTLSFSDSKQTNVVISEAYGYGGPITVATTFDKQKHRITGLNVLEHKETPAYLQRVENSPFMRQFRHQPLNKSFLLGNDIDGLSGATFTSNGIAEAVKTSAHQQARLASMDTNWATPHWQFGLQELAAIMMIIAVLMTNKVPHLWQKKYSLCVSIASVAVIGFWLNSALSLATVSSVLLGYLPPPQTHLLWYIMVFGVLLPIIIQGKNIYCNRLCPFFHIQRWLNKLSGLNYAIPARIKNHIKLWVNSFLWVSLILIFLSRTPAIASYEPFAMLFSLNGVGIQWYILPMSLFGAFFVNGFWCRLFCPMGRILNASVETRNRSKNWVSKQLTIPVRNVAND